MAVFEKFRDAMLNNDIDALAAMSSDDLAFISHRRGETLDKAAMMEMMRGLFSSGFQNVGEMRRIYENDDILVTHEVIDFADGDREAVLSACTLKDGKITRIETGATPVAR